MILGANRDISLNSVNHLIYVMVKCGVLSEVRTEFLKKGNENACHYCGLLVEVKTANLPPRNIAALLQLQKAKK
jgi:DNA-directed RNA polymerase subunit RPC12/RpoP